jgi:hypothetical protein
MSIQEGKYLRLIAFNHEAGRGNDTQYADDSTPLAISDTSDCSASYHHCMITR